MDARAGVRTRDGCARQPERRSPPAGSRRVSSRACALPVAARAAANARAWMRGLASAPGTVARGNLKEEARQPEAVGEGANGVLIGWRASSGRCRVIRQREKIYSVK